MIPITALPSHPISNIFYLRLSTKKKKNITKTTIIQQNTKQARLNSTRTLQTQGFQTHCGSFHSTTNLRISAECISLIWNWHLRPHFSQKLQLHKHRHALPLSDCVCVKMKYPIISKWTYIVKSSNILIICKKLSWRLCINPTKKKQQKEKNPLN